MSNCDDQNDLLFILLLILAMNADDNDFANLT